MARRSSTATTRAKGDVAPITARNTTMSKAMAVLSKYMGEHIPPNAAGAAARRLYWYSSPSTSITPAMMVARLAARPLAELNLGATPVTR